MKREISTGELQTPLMPLGDAIGYVTGRFSALPVQERETFNALGLVLAHDIASSIDIPAHACSTMDGFAISGAQTHSASNTSPLRLDKFEKIMTGWALPPFADAVVPWEDAQCAGDELTVCAPFPPGTFVRQIGEDLKSEQIALPQGTRLDAVHLAILASLGRSRVCVIPTPQVAVLCTGDELHEPGTDLPPGHVYNANAVMLDALLSRQGVETKRIERSTDDPDAITRWLIGSAANADVIITIGGASVGESDWMRSVLTQHGTLDLWRVALKPGKPFGLGTINNTPVFVLPGNPGSVLACFHAFVVPALRLMSGQDPRHVAVTAVLTSDVQAPAERTYLCPVQVEGETAIPHPGHSSSTLINQVDCNGFAIVPPGGLQAGDDITVELFS